MVILQSVVAFVFMERHWNTVTQRLSAAVVQDIAALIDVYKAYPQDSERTQIRRIARDRLGLVVDFLPATEMPPPGAETVLFPARSGALDPVAPADRPAVLDRHRRALGAGRDPHPARRRRDAGVRPPRRRLCVEFRDLPALDARHFVGPARRRRSVPAQPDPADSALADAAESFGKGREVPNFRPRGAREVRRAAQAFIEMKTRIERSDRAAHRRCWPASRTTCAPS